MKAISFLGVIFSMVCILNCKPALHDEKVKIVHVFRNVDLKKKEFQFPRNDFYYVYNFQPADTAVILRILDTLTIDSLHRFHFISFYKYDESMPDTAMLSKAMNEGSFEMQDEPGAAAHHNNRILVYSYNKSFLSQGRKYPGSYAITNYTGDNESERHFLKNEKNKLIEVADYLVLPRNK